MRFSVSTKIFLGFSVVILCFGMVSVYSIYRMRTLGENIRFLREGVIPARDALKGLDWELKAFEEALGRRQPGDVEWVRSFLPSLQPFGRVDAMRVRVEAVSRRAHLKPRDRRILLSLSRELARIADERVALDGLRETRGLLVVQALLTGEDAPTSDRELYGRLAGALAQKVTEGDLAAARELQTAIRSVLRRLDRRLVALGRSFARTIDTTYTQAERDEDNAILAVIVISTVALFISLAALVISHLTLSPIRQLREGVRRISQGDYGRRVPVSTQDEIGQLAAEFNKMAESLMERDRMLARQREALVHAERLATIGKMSAHVTHEIRNPLSSIGLNVELLEEELEAAAGGDAGAAAEARALIAAVTAEVDRLRGVTEQYLRFARLPQPDRGPGDVVKVVDALLRFVAGELDAGGVALTAELDPLPELEIDVQQLRQAFLNLVRNAAEAMPEGGRLHVSTAREGDGAVVRFRDTGVGIDPAELDKVFDPFFSTKRTGTGLGLALTQQIIAAHDGAIEVESERGSGTTVTVRFPFAAGGRPTPVEDGEDLA